ncbi:hypothetical protein BC332_19218 [Capsicum chinense]|nr:hypothetical protein BC332_19218 [Capsicum chinense]
MTVENSSGDLLANKWISFALENKLLIEDPEKLHIIVVSNPSLEIFLVHLPSVNGKIVIESLNLKSLEFISFSMTFCEVEITSTTTVRQLTLRDAYDPETLMHFKNKFPLLEKLVIDSFNNIGDVEITSMPTVRNLILCNINVDDDGYVNDGDNEDTPWISFVDKFPLLEKLVIDSCGKLQNLHVSQQNLVSLVLKDSLVADEVIIFPVEMDDVLPVNGIKNLGLEIINCHATTEEISDDLIWLLPDLKTLSLTLGSITEVIERLVLAMAQSDHHKEMDESIID